MTNENNNGTPPSKSWINDADQRIKGLPAGSLREMAAKLGGTPLTTDDEGERDAYHNMVGQVSGDHASTMLDLFLDCLIYGGAVFAAAYVWKAPKLSKGWKFASLIGIGGAAVVSHRIIKRRKVRFHRAG